MNLVWDMLNACVVSSMHGESWESEEEVDGRLRHA